MRKQYKQDVAEVSQSLTAERMSSQCHHAGNAQTQKPVANGRAQLHGIVAFLEEMVGGWVSEGEEEEMSQHG